MKHSALAWAVDRRDGRVSCHDGVQAAAGHDLVALCKFMQSSFGTLCVHTQRTIHRTVLLRTGT